MRFGVILIALAIIATLFIVAPLVSLVMQVPWSNLPASLENLEPFKLSIWTSTLATLFALMLGVPLAWILAKSNGRIAGTLRPLILSPIVLPPTVAGLALLSLWGRNGDLGHVVYETSGWSVPFTSTAVVIAGVFVSTPFVVLICESNFRQLPREIEDAAIIDRATNKQIFEKIALPQSRNSIFTAGLLAWARAIGEFGATLMFAGSFPGTTQTWPMFIYQQLDVEIETAYTNAILMLFLAIFVVYLLRNQLRETFR